MLFGRHVMLPVFGRPTSSRRGSRGLRADVASDVASNVSGVEAMWFGAVGRRILGIPGGRCFGVPKTSPGKRSFSPCLCGEVPSNARSITVEVDERLNDWAMLWRSMR
jgi:hypothetical protein